MSTSQNILQFYPCLKRAKNREYFGDKRALLKLYRENYWVVENILGICFPMCYTNRTKQYLAPVTGKVKKFSYLS